MINKACPKCSVEKPLSGFHNHKGKPYGKAIWCRECASANSAKHYSSVPRDVRLKNKRVWQSNNRDKVNTYNNDWRKGNLHKVAERQRARNARVSKARPSWLSKDQKAYMQDLYKLCKKLSKTFPAEYQVDHIIPLKGKEVCGLHVPWNLQVLEKSLNLSKSNKLTGDLINVVIR